MTARSDSVQASPDMGLDHYLPLWVRERLSSDPEAAASSSARQLDAAVLLVDIVGFKALTEQFTKTGPRGAESLRGILNRYFGTVSQLVAAHGGDTVTFAGDALLAFWAADDAGPQSACLAAARCALAVRDAVDALAPNLSVPLQQRLAVDFGSVTLLEILGSDARRFALLMGEPLRSVAVTCRGASPNSVKVSHAAWRFIADECSAASNDGKDATITSAGLHTSPDARPPLPRLPEAQLAHYLPRNLVERLRAGQGDWLAEFRNLSIVFVNLGDTNTAASDLPARLERALAAAQAIEAKTGGAIYQFLMDDKGINLILAFGLPLYRQEDDAARAVEAATLLRDALLECGFEPSIGVATGQSFCGTCGEQRRQYSIIGAPINRAARLMQDARGDALFDDATAAATASYFEFAQGPFGKRDPQRRATLPPADMDGTLVGRERELAALLEHLAALQQGRGGLVLVEGEAGIGKTRLISELCSQATRQGVRILHGAATSLERSTPYYFWREPLKQLLGAAANVGPAELGQCALARLAGRPDLSARAALLADVLPLHLPESELSRLITGVARVAAIHDLLIYLLSAKAQEGPTLVVIDDVHWLDSSSVEALATIVQRVPKLLLLGSSRPAEAGQSPQLPPLAKHAQATLHIEALPREALERLIAQKLGTQTVPRALATFAFDRTLGHPLFCEELVLSLRDAGVITLEGDAYTAPDDALEHAVTKVPATLQRVIVSRIDRLPTDAQLAIKVAGVIGRSFSLRMLGEIYPVPIADQEILALVQRLVASDFLQAIGSGDDQRFRFKHVIAQESVVDLVLFAQRQQLHGKIARWLETHHALDPEPHLAELALHWELAEDVEKAIGYLERAGELSLRRYANREAVRAVRKAFELCSSQAFEPGPARRARWESIIGHAWHELSDSVRSSEHFNRALSLRGYRVAQSGLEVGLGVGKQLVIQLCRRLGLWRPSEDTARADAAHMFARLGEHWYFENDSFRVLYATLCSLNHAEASNSRRMVDGFGAMAVGLGIAGMHRLARYYLNRAVLRAEQLNIPADMAYAQLLAGVYAAGKADWPSMSVSLERASKIYEQLGDPFRWQQSQAILCFGALVRGDHALAKALLGEIAAASTRMSFMQVNAWVWSARMALALAENGELAEQIAAFDAIRTNALPVSERLLCMGLLAEAQLRSGASVDALGNADAALTSMLNSPPTAWHVGPGVKGIAETYLGLLERGEVAIAQRAAIASQARRACRAIQRFARTSLSCQPLALRVAARMSWIDGHPRRALGLANASLEAARRLSLTLDERLAERELSRIAGQRPHQALAEQKEHDG